MNRLIASLLTLSLLALPRGNAAAANPTVAECLAASDASASLARAHRLRAERAQLTVCASASCPTDIRKDCLGHMDEVTGQIPTIIFAAKDRTGADVKAVTVSMDGEVLAQKLDGTALAIDPGEHGFTFEMPGQPPVTRTLIIRQSQKDRQELVTFGPPASAGVTPAGPAAPASTSSSGLGTQKIIAIAAAGLGLVGLGVGTAFGLVAISAKSTAQSECPTSVCGTADGLTKWNNAATAGNLSTIGFVVGGVGLAGAATLWFTAPKASSVQTGVGIGPGTLQLRGAF